MNEAHRRAWVLFRLLAERFAAFVATVAGAVALVLVLLRFAPGDAIDTLPNGEEIRPVLEREWGLDQPIWSWYLEFLWRMLHGDLGTSLTYRTGAPVFEVIAGPAARSMGWLFMALALCLFGGTALALWTAGRKNPVRTFVHGLSITPLFLLAHASVLALNESVFWAIERGYIARPDWFALPDQASWVRSALAISLLAFGSGAFAEVHQAVEDVLHEIQRSPYVDAARARGASLWPHITSNLVAPLAGIASSRAAFFVGGLVILEKVLLLNGIGAILWQAALDRDYNVALGVTVVLATAVAGVRLVGDAIRLYADPRLAEAT